MWRSEIVRRWSSEIEGVTGGFGGGKGVSGGRWTEQRGSRLCEARRETGGEKRIRWRRSPTCTLHVAAWSLQAHAGRPIDAHLPSPPGPASVHSPLPPPTLSRHRGAGRDTRVAQQGPIRHDLRRVVGRCDLRRCGQQPAHASGLHQSRLAVFPNMPPASVPDQAVAASTV